MSDEMNPIDFSPSASIANIKRRSEMYAQIRQFFSEHDVLEVETPIVSQYTVTDVHLQSIPVVRQFEATSQPCFLQTSPEFFMKRLLAAGSGAIYQICKVFRDGEHGRKHNSEFSMLEWYRPNYTLEQLMQEIELLCAKLFNWPEPFAFERLSYKQAFINRLNIDPLTADLAQLKKSSLQLGLNVDLTDDRLAYLDLLFSHFVEPSLGYDAPVFLTEFPAEMASLAKTKMDLDGQKVAARFELYILGFELANAYDELADGALLAERFAEDNRIRAAQGKQTIPIDPFLIAAVDQLPDCVGVALGLDRLLMLILQAQRINDVLSFDAAQT